MRMAVSTLTLAAVESGEGVAWTRRMAGIGIGGGSGVYISREGEFDTARERIGRVFLFLILAPCKQFVYGRIVSSSSIFVTEIVIGSRGTEQNLILPL